MKFMKRFLILTLVFSLSLSMLTGMAHAWDFNFTFSDLTSKYDTPSKKADNSVNEWSITISTGSNVSSINVFGARPRQGGSESALGSYRTFTNTGTYGRSYYSSTTDNITVFLRCKKDDSSAYAEPLNVFGNFTP